MPTNRFPLFLFDRWQHAVAQEILEKSDAAEIRFLKSSMPGDEYMRRSIHIIDLRCQTKMKFKLMALGAQIHGK